MDNGGEERVDRSPPPGNQSSACFARPLLLAAISFIIGICLSYLRSWTNPGAIGCMVAALLAASLSLGRLRLRKFSSLPIFLLSLTFFGLGALASALSTPELPAPPTLTPFFERPQTLFLAEVISPPEFYPDKTRITIRLREAFTADKTIPVEGGVLLTVGKARNEPGLWLLGDKLLARLTLKRLHGFNNPGGYDYARRQAEKGIHARAFVEDDRMLVKISPSSESSLRLSIGGKVETFRQRAIFWIKSQLDPDSAGFYGALLLGYKIPKEWMEHLSRAGVTHLVCISGLHLALVSMSVFWISCRLARLLAPTVLLVRTSDRHIGLWAAFGAAALYSLVSGLTLPTWRSLIMLGLSFGALHLYRRSDALSALAAAAVSILLISPNSLWEVTFQLSFGAMFGLFIIYPRFRKLQDRLWRKTPERVQSARFLLRPFDDAFWVSVAANVAVLPLIAHHFHGISVAGFFANTVLVPAIGFLVLPLGLLSIALYAVNEPLALPFLKIGAWFLGYCEDAIVWFSELSWAFFWVGAISAPWLAAFYASLGLLLSRCRLSIKAASIGALILVCSAVAYFDAVLSFDNDARKNLEVVAIDVGQGSSTLVRFPTGETMLIDGGGFYDDSFDIGRSVLAPFLWHSGIRKLDYVVLSHDHPDHRNGLRFILSYFDVGCFWESGIVDRLSGKNELALIAARRGIPVLKLSDLVGDRIIAGCRISVLHPSLSYIEKEWDGEDLNNVSLVLKIDFGATRLIVPGDIDQSVERRLFSDDAVCDQTLLIAPHHGSKRSNSSLLLDRLQPGGVIFSCGYDNLFGFPSPTVLAEYRKRNIPCFRTDLQGAVYAFSDGAKWIEIRGVTGLQPTNDR